MVASAATWLRRAPAAAVALLLLPGGASASTAKFPFQNLQDMVNKGAAEVSAATTATGAATVNAADGP